MKKQHRNGKAESVKENCDEWLSTRNRKKAPVRSIPKKMSSVAGKLSTPWKLTQNSPSPKQLTIPTHQTTMTSYLLKGQQYLDQNLGAVVKPSLIRGPETEIGFKSNSVEMMEISDSHRHFKSDLSVDCRGSSYYDITLVPRRDSMFTKNDYNKSMKQPHLSSCHNVQERFDSHQNIQPLHERINVLSEEERGSLNRKRDCNVTDHSSVDHTINKVADHSQKQFRGVLQQINMENSKHGFKDSHTRDTNAVLLRRSREVTKLSDNTELHLSLFPEDKRVTDGTAIATCYGNTDSEDISADVGTGEDYNNNGCDYGCDNVNGNGVGDFIEDSSSLVFSPFINSKSSMTLFLTSTQEESCSSDVNLTFDFDDSERLTSEPVSSLVLLEDSLSLKTDPISLDSESLYLTQSQSEIGAPSLEDFTFH